MDREDAATTAKFECGLAKVAQVRDSERLFGDPDHLARVATADIAAYQTAASTGSLSLARAIAAELDFKPT
jgi:hypothetical protein